MRKIILVVVSILFFQIVLATDLFIDSSQTVINDTDFVVNISINATEDVYGFESNVFFNPRKLRAKSVSKDDFLGEYNETFFVPYTIDNNIGKISNIAGTRIGVQTGVIGFGNLATITFHSISTGMSNIGLGGVSVVNSSIEEIEVSVTNTSVIIANRPPVIDSFQPVATELVTRENSPGRLYKWYIPLFNTIQFNHTSHDPDGDVLSYSWLLDRREIATTQDWLYSPNLTDVGNHNITLIVSDSQETDSQSWNVTVKLRGDVVEDCKVNILDINKVIKCFRKVTKECSTADIYPPPRSDGTPEGDGTVNVFDLTTVTLNLGRKCGLVKIIH